MKISEDKIKKILLSFNYVRAEEMKSAEEYAKLHRSSVLDYLLSTGVINKDIIGQAIAEDYGVPYSDLNSYPPSPDFLKTLPEEISKKYHVVPFALKGNAGDKAAALTVTTDDPKQTGLLEALSVIFPKQKIIITYSLEEDIDDILKQYRKALETRFADIIREQKRVAPQIFEEMLKDALVFRASDIHIEPFEKEVIVRFRVDGVLQEAGRLPKQYYENILNRIKVQAHLRIDEHLAAQDGSLRFVADDGNAVDLRVSIAPTLDGEKVVMRVLAHYVKTFSLTDLGLSSVQQEMLVRAADKPFGMILVAGPTGSGKTTTLYALLKHIANPEVNVTTIEDPVEYKIEGINQIQVNTQTGLTFSKGLRSIVRQDPDIILVGEIRDEETAEIAVNAALTGHLLFSTFHANDAATSIPRLLDMKVEPFLLGSTLELIISQRLARKICEHCRQSVRLDWEAVKKMLPSAENYFSSRFLVFYAGKGCDICSHTGYKGRVALFEFITVTPEMKDLILKNPSTREIWGLAHTQGSLSMFEDGIDKVKNGITTLDELLRVVQPPDNMQTNIVYENKKNVLAQRKTKSVTRVRSSQRVRGG